MESNSRFVTGTAKPAGTAALAAGRRLGAIFGLYRFGQTGVEARFNGIEGRLTL